MQNKVLPSVADSYRRAAQEGNRQEVVEGRQEGTQGWKHGVEISKFYVQEKRLMKAGHAGQPGEEGERQEETQTLSERQLPVGLQH